MNIAPSLKWLSCWLAVACFVTIPVSAQDAEKTDDAKPAETKPVEEKKPETEPPPKKEEAKPAEDPKEETKPADDKKPAEEPKPADDKKPADPPKEETKPADDKKPADPPKEETKPADDKKPADPPKEEPTLEMTEVVINLDNPSGLTIHPKTGHVFIASNDGVHRFLPESLPRKCPLEVSDFPTDIYGKGPKYNISALGVAFLDDDHLIVGDGSLPDGEELVRIYKVEAEHPGKYQKADEAAFTVGPITAGEQSARGEGNYYGVAVLDGTAYVTNNGDDTKGWISKFSMKDGKPTELEPFIATKVAVEVDAPVPIAALDGKLYVGQMGEVSKPGDSLLTVYDPKTYDPAKPAAEKKWETGLSDIAGLAYSPKTKKWYCTDFAWAEPENGGLFELTVDGDKLEAKKLAKLDKPTALAFDKDGNLYVTMFGTQKSEDAKMTPGKLLMINADQLK